ncbi:MAG: hypothetical protein ABIM89_05000 [Mycobacteriales bacterium]
MYSLVSSSLLTIDLVRHPNGIELADVLERALCLTQRDIVALEAAFENTVERRAAWAAVQEVTTGSPRLLTVLASAREAFENGPPEEVQLSKIGHDLSTTPMGNLPELLSMVERDVLDWTRETHGDLVVQRHTPGVAVVRDAVAAAYTRLVIAPEHVAALTESWAAVFGGMPAVGVAGDEFGPQTAVVRRAVDMVVRMDPQSFQELNQTYWRDYRPEAGWAPAMHAASWAAVLSGRLRPVAAAQLAMLRAMLLGGLPSMTGASGVMMSATAAMQAVVLADVLDEATYEALTYAWASAFGPLA